MQRLKWPFFFLCLVFVFTSGVLCGMHWQAHPPFAFLRERLARQQAPDADTGAFRVAAPEPAGDDAALSPVWRSPSRPETPEAAADSPSPEFVAAPLAAPEKRPAPAPEPKAPALAEKKPAPAPAEPARAASVALVSPPTAERLPFAPSPYSFILKKLGPGNGNTLMVVGGIQGDEPGGFSAAALLAAHYRVKSGAVWVVPNLNFHSILNRSRGDKGDMNRKFAKIRADDPDYAIVKQLKSILLQDEVSVILNLHDGSGFYRPTWEDGLRNPRRWGQSVIIDQEEMEAPRFNRLFETASLIGKEVNQKLLDPNHRYHIYNTYTAAGNVEMAKTLSYFAVCNGKPAFGVEASKEIRPEYRAYYHLQVIEAFMRQMGIAFERDFLLTPEGVLEALNSDLRLALYDNKVILALDNIRPVLNRMPFKKGATPQVRASKPLLALVEDPAENAWRIAYGNRTLTRIKPEFMDFDNSLQTLEIEVDGKPRIVPVGEIITVDKHFLVRPRPGYRVNAIGAQKEVNGDEAGVRITRDDFMPRFSMDTQGSIYRVEVYRGAAFAGMVLARFGSEAEHIAEPLTATGGRESSLGF
jgi:hypothetical protein